MISQNDIAAARAQLAGVALRTPTLPLVAEGWADVLPKGAQVTLKLELFQQAGSFKARGAYLGVQAMSEAAKARGVVAASGGNHAMAVSWAAKAAGISATIAMPRATDPLRIMACESMGAHVILCTDIADAFSTMTTCARTEGRHILHPFEDETMALGAATCGAEFVEGHPDIDVFVVPVGGGGLISGMAAAIKMAKPTATIIGVEPEGADSLRRSLHAGTPVTLDRVMTIADSLGAPYALPKSFTLAQNYVDEVVTVPDDALRAGMRQYMDRMRIMAEPACAASLAGLVGPLSQYAKGQKIGLIACGSNISPDRYHTLLAHQN